MFTVLGKYCKVVLPFRLTGGSVAVRGKAAGFGRFEQLSSQLVVVILWL